MTDLIRDIRHALRSATRSPGYSLVTILTLAIAIGATTTIASVVERALLRPLSFVNDEQLVTLLESNGSSQQRLASYPVYLDWVEQSRSFSDLSFIRGNSGILKDTDGAEQVLIGYVSPRYFAMMGANPALGRTFGAEEERNNSGNVAVLSHEFWLRRFGGDESIIGQTLRMDDGILTVVGVMPAGAAYPAWADLLRPIAAVLSTDPALAQRGVRSDSRVVARLRPGVSTESATAEMGAVAKRIASAYPADAEGWTSVQLTPLRDEVIGNVRPMLLTLGAAVLFGLLIACVNVANLSLVRAAARTREVAVRAALGASRGRIARQLLAESLVLASAAGLVGLLITQWATSALRAAAPAALPRAAELTVDIRVLAVALVLTLLTAALCGLAPAIHMARSDLAGMMRGGRASGSATARGRRVQSALTVVQFALALMLLVGAGLLVQSYRKVQAVDVGFDPHGIVALRVIPPSPRYDAAPAVASLYERLLTAMRELPDVSAAAVVNHAPLTSGGIPTQVCVPGRVIDSTGGDAALYKTVSADYLRVMDIPLLQGRWFTNSDMTSAATGVVISKTMANRFWPDVDPIGRTLTIFKSSQVRPDFGAPVTVQVIGVVGDVLHFGMESQALNEVYVPYTSEPWPHSMLLVRTTRSTSAFVQDMRGAVLSVDRDIPVSGSGQGAGIQPLDRNIETLMATRSWMMSMVVAFAASALLLAALGIYGVTAYLVAQRTHEMGIRVALGASRRQVMTLVLRRGVLHALLGVVIGLSGAFALTRLVRGLLFGTSPTEPLIFVLGPALLTLVALAACYVPARRAARVDPVVALRAE